MKIKFLSYFIIFVSLFLPFVTFAESVESFNSKIYIRADSSLDITESVTYDFGQALKHGIFREIPYLYKVRGGNYTLEIKVNSVKDEQGGEYPYSVSKSSGKINVKIGNPKILISGQHTFVLNYKVFGAINYFDRQDELYWNVTGNGWGVPILGPTAEVYLPKEVNVKDLNLLCFVGLSGSSQSCGSSSFSTGLQGTASKVTFSDQSLGASEGLTVVLGFPKNLVTKPNPRENFIRTLKDNWIIFLPILVFFVLLWIWLKKGRDPFVSSVVIPQYEPQKDLTPAEAGAIIDEEVDSKDISASILQLAISGYIRIERIGKKVWFIESSDYQLNLLKPASSLENEFEKKLLNSLFGDKDKVLLSELKTSFYQDAEIVKDLIYKSVVKKGYFDQNPQTVRTYFRVGGVVLVGLGVFILLGHQNVYAAISLAVSGLLVMIFEFYMPAKTKKGAEAKQYLLGLKRYIDVAEKDRINFHNAPEKNAKVFETLLPYALVFGVEKKWAEQFKDIYKNPPDWYRDGYGNNFNSLILLNSLQDFNTETQKTFSSAAAGGGSGFSGGSSGGGFGGGGGGSW